MIESGNETKMARPNDFVHLLVIYNLNFMWFYGLNDIFLAILFEG